MRATPRLAFPHASSTPQPLTFAQVAKAYQFPAVKADGSALTGAGQKIAIVELGGAYSPTDLRMFCEANGIPMPKVTATAVGGASIVSDPGGANVEVMLDVEAVAAIAPGAEILIFFGDNTDAGFLAAFKAAILSGAIAVSCSWGGPGSSWDENMMRQYDNLFAQALAAGVIVCCAAGDAGKDDGTSAPVADFPASSPHVLACGGTRLIVDAAGNRLSETVWDDAADDATGGGVSTLFPAPPWQTGTGTSMRAIPDVAGNADPESGFEIVADGQSTTVGGTSGVAPLYAALFALFGELGVSAAVLAQFFATLYGNLQTLTDITAGGRGDVYPPSTGYDEASGLGVVIGTALAAVLTSSPAPTPPPVTPPAPVPLPSDDADVVLWRHVHTWAHKPHVGEAAGVARALRVWAGARGYHRAA